MGLVAEELKFYAALRSGSMAFRFDCAKARTRRAQADLMSIDIDRPMGGKK
jgi:hypothetical protein